MSKYVRVCEGHPGGRREGHGGATAYQAIVEGESFRGLAAREELSVKRELEEVGSLQIIVTGAVRLQTAANLYWAALCKAAQDGNLEALDRYVARFGWLQSKALTAWTQLRQEERQNPGELIHAAMVAAKEVKGEGPN